MRGSLLFAVTAGRAVGHVEVNKLLCQRMAGQVRQGDIGAAHPMALLRDRIGAEAFRHGAPDKLGTVEIVLAVEIVAPVEGGATLGFTSGPGKHPRALVSVERQAEDSDMVDIAEKGLERDIPDGADRFAGPRGLSGIARSGIGVNDARITASGVWAGVRPAFALRVDSYDEADMAPAPVGRIRPARSELRPDCRAGPLEDKIARLQDRAEALRQPRGPIAIRSGQGASRCRNSAKRACDQYFEKHVLTELADGTEIFCLASSSPLPSVSPVRMALAMALASLIGIGSPE